MTIRLDQRVNRPKLADAGIICTASSVAASMRFSLRTLGDGSFSLPYGRSDDNIMISEFLVFLPAISGQHAA